MEVYNKTLYYLERQVAGNYIRYVFAHSFYIAYKILVQYGWKPVNPEEKMTSVIMKHKIDGKNFTIHVRSDTTTPNITYLTIEEKYDADLRKYFNIKQKEW